MKKCRIEAFKNKEVSVKKATDLLMKLSDGLLDEKDVTERLNKKIDEITTIFDLQIEEYAYKIEAKKVINQEMVDILKSSKIIGSTKFSDLSTQSKKIFQNIYSSSKTKNNYGFNVTLGYQFSKIKSKIQNDKHFFLKSLGVKSAGIFQDATTIAKNMKEEVFHKEFWDSIINNKTSRDDTPEKIMVHKLAKKIKGFIKNEIEIKSDEELNLAILSGNFSNRKLMKLRETENDVKGIKGALKGKTTKFYNLMYGKNRVVTTKKEHKRARELFVKNHSKDIKDQDPRVLERLFDLLGDFKSSDAIRDPTLSTKRSTLSNYGKLNDILEKLNGSLTREELISIVNKYQKTPLEMLEHHSQTISTHKIVSKEFGRNPYKTFSDISKIADNVLGNGEEKALFNSRLSLMNDLVDSAFFFNKQNSIGNMFNEIIFNQFVPIVKSSILMGSAVRYIAEPSLLLTKEFSLRGKFNKVKDAKYLMDTTMEIEGLALRSLAKKLNNNPLFKGYSDQIQNVVKKLDLSKMSKMSIESQLEILESIGAHLGEFNTFAGVVDTGNKKETEGVVNTVSSFLGGFSGLEALDQVSSFLSMNRTKKLMSDILKLDNDKIISDPKNPINKLIQNSGINKKELELLNSIKRMNKIKNGIENDYFDKGFYNEVLNDKPLRNVLEEMVIPEKLEDLNPFDKADFITKKVDEEIKKIIDFSLDGKLRKNNEFLDLLNISLGKILEEPLIKELDLISKKNVDEGKFELSDVDDVFDFKYDTEKGEISVEYKKEATLNKQKRIEYMVNRTLNDNLDIVRRKKRQDFEDHFFKGKDEDGSVLGEVRSFLEDRYTEDGSVGEDVLKYHLEDIKSKVSNLENEVFQFLNAPKPNEEIKLALRQISKNSEEMETATNMIETALTFMSSRLSSAYQAKATIKNFGSHIDKSNHGMNVENAKLLSNITIHTLLIGMYTGIASNLGASLVGKDKKLDAFSIAKSGYQQSIIANALGTYGNKYGSVTSSYIASILEGDTGKVIKLANRNPIVYNMFTKALYDNIQ